MQFIIVLALGKAATVVLSGTAKSSFLQSFMLKRMNALLFIIGSVSGRGCFGAPAINFTLKRIAGAPKHPPLANEPIFTQTSLLLYSAET